MPTPRAAHTPNTSRATHSAPAYTNGDFAARADILFQAVSCSSRPKILHVGLVWHETIPRQPRQKKLQSRCTQTLRATPAADSGASPCTQPRQSTGSKPCSPIQHTRAPPQMHACGPRTTARLFLVPAWCGPEATRRHTRHTLSGTKSILGNFKYICPLSKNFKSTLPTARTCTRKKHNARRNVSDATFSARGDDPCQKHSGTRYPQRWALDVLPRLCHPDQPRAPA